jgi:hypothetical protein
MHERVSYIGLSFRLRPKQRKELISTGTQYIFMDKGLKEFGKIFGFLSAKMFDEINPYKRRCPL